MLTEDKRIRIIVGHYGSGKSEFAINYALQLRNITNDKIALSDLDVVNVYFRSREQEKMLESNNIHTIHSSINANALDLPAISAEITTPIRDEKYNYIIDVGGDSIGAKVLGRFSKDIKMTDYDMLFVINGNREKTQTVEEIIRYIKEIEFTSKLKVTGLINNTHLLRETRIEDIIKGQKLASQVSNILAIPIKYTSCIEPLVEVVKEHIENDILPIKMYLRKQWM